MAYVPMRISLGSLPEYDDELKSYDLQLDGKIPAEAKEVLLYTFVTTRGDRDDFHRGYYEISTSQGEKTYPQYMNVAVGPKMMSVNSSNLWLPVGDGKVNVKLRHTEGKPTLEGKAEKLSDWSEVFVIGYKC